MIYYEIKLSIGLCFIRMLWGRICLFPLPASGAACTPCLIVPFSIIKASRAVSSHIPDSDPLAFLPQGPFGLFGAQEDNLGKSSLLMILNFSHIRYVMLSEHNSQVLGFRAWTSLEVYY